MLPDEKIFCHRTGFQETCFDMVTRKKCQLWIEVLGNHPQTNETVHQHVCSDAVTPLLIIQGNQLQSQNTASVDKVANEVKAQRDENVALGSMAISRSKEVMREYLDSSTQQIAIPVRRHLLLERSGRLDEETAISDVSQ